MDDQYFYIKDGTRMGPVPFSELKAMAAHQSLRRTDKIWKDGMPSWQSAETVSEIFQGLPPDIEVPSPKQGIPPLPAGEVKSPTTQSAGLLAALSFFLPGVGQMVCGQTAKGAIFLIAAIILNVLTSGLVSLIICPFAAFDAYQLASKRNAGAAIGDWDFMPSGSKATNPVAIWVMVGLVALLTVIAMFQQQREAQDQRFNTLMDTIQQAGSQQ
jgi:hypothetical protein